MEQSHRNTPAEPTKRRLIVGLVGLFLLPSLVACRKSGKASSKDYGFDVMMYNFLDRSIFDIHLNGLDIGLANKYGRTGILTGVAVPMGEQSLSWRLGGPIASPRNGERVAMKSIIIIKESEIPAEAEYLGIYLYPDYTAEFAFTKYIPPNSDRGEAIMKKLEK